MIVFSHQEVIKMNCKFLSVPRRAFTWLDDTFLIVTSVDQDNPSGHCIALNTVSRLGCVRFEVEQLWKLGSMKHYKSCFPQHSFDTLI